MLILDQTVFELQEPLTLWWATNDNRRKSWQKAETSENRVARRAASNYNIRFNIRWMGFLVRVLIVATFRHTTPFMSDALVLECRWIVCVCVCVGRRGVGTADRESTVLCYGVVFVRAQRILPQETSEGQTQGHHCQETDPSKHNNICRLNQKKEYIVPQLLWLHFCCSLRAVRKSLQNGCRRFIPFNGCIELY